MKLVLTETPVNVKLDLFGVSSAVLILNLSIDIFL